MSVLANQPRKHAAADTPLGRIQRFGIPVPARVAQFLETEVAQYEGVRAWGLEGWSADVKMKVQWAAKRLADCHEYATDSDYYADGAAQRYLPLAWVGDEWNMFAVDVSNPALPVCFFESDSGFKEWAPSFDDFLRKLLRKGEKTPAEKLAKAYEEACALNEEKQYAQVLALLEPVCSQFRSGAGGAWDGTRDTLGAAWNLVGIAHEHLGDIERAIATYETAYELGAESAALNVCDLYLNHFKDYGKLVAYGEALREKVYAIGDTYAWFHVRNYLGQGYLLTGKPALAVRAYHQIWTSFVVEEPAKLQQAVKELRELLATRPEADRAAGEAILGWLDAPVRALPEDRLEAMREWWSRLSEPVSDAIKEAIHIEDEPTDADFARIDALTDLSVDNAEVEDVEWVTMLPRLEELSLEGNALVDISPLSAMTRLRDLDISENQIESLRPLAPLVRMERLSVGENKLSGLEGLEGMRRLHYFHANECGLESVEPMRGLPELVEVTVYSNEIDDISPFSQSPRIKELSTFSNPLSRGVRTLAALPWLESFDAGDDADHADVRALKQARPDIKIDHWYPDDDEDAEPEEPFDPAIRAWWRALSPEWRKALDSELDSDERGKDDPSDDALRDLVRGDSLHVDDRRLPGSLEPLRRFTRLDYLNLGNTGAIDLTPIADLPRLRDLLIRNNPIASLSPLAAAKYLEELYMEHCGLSSLAGLERCAHLRELHAEDNLVVDLAPLASLTELRVLDLEGNRVRSLAPLADLPRLHTLKLGGNQITDLSPLATCRELRVVEVWANAGIHHALALADHPELTRLITHGSAPASELAELRRRRPDVVID